MERVKEESSYILESNRKVGVHERGRFLSLWGSARPSSTGKSLLGRGLMSFQCPANWVSLLAGH